MRTPTLAVPCCCWGDGLIEAASNCYPKAAAAKVASIVL
jgi:hypothetical protein